MKTVISLFDKHKVASYNFKLYTALRTGLETGWYDLSAIWHRRLPCNTL